jgi:hypothetical protein
VAILNNGGRPRSVPEPFAALVATEEPTEAIDCHVKWPTQTDHHERSCEMSRVAEDANKANDENKANGNHTVEKVRQVAFCPHCGHDSPQLLLTLDFERVGYHHGDFFTFVICDTCGCPLIYLTRLRLGKKHKERGAFYYGLRASELVYPKPDAIHRAVPEKITRSFAEALKIKRTAPTAFAALIRRCLEMVCHERGAVKGVLAAKLNDLAAKGDIPPALAGMTEVIRDLGNTASHDDVEIEAEFADVIEDFFRAILDYVYVRPHQIKDIATKLGQARKKMQARRA